jgi:hypothetical protein
VVSDPTLSSLADRIIACFDAPSEAEPRLEHVVDPATGEIETRHVETGLVLEDGELDMEELDLSLVCYASRQRLDAVGFLEEVDADGNGRIGRAELERLLATMAEPERQSLAVKLTALEALDADLAAREADFAQAGRIDKLIRYRSLKRADEKAHAARVDFVEHLVAYARPGIG